jgi:hypothetical protein
MKVDPGPCAGGPHADRVEVDLRPHARVPVAAERLTLCLSPKIDGIISAVQSAWAYLNVENPIVAWLVYRGEMFSANRVQVPPDEVWTPLSIFHTSRLRSAAVSAGAAYTTERAIDDARHLTYPEKISRLSGFYVFGDEESARRAEALWDGNFRREFMCEVGISPESNVTRYDSNWITHEFRSGPGNWVDRYVAGEPYDNAPLWEYVIEGTALVFGTALRERAYATVTRTWPESLALLELGRIAAALGSQPGKSRCHPSLRDPGSTHSLLPRHGRCRRA